MRALAVFCGSALGTDARFAEVAGALGREAAARRIAIVYGGASVGLMGVVADAALAAGGEVVGVLPRHLADREVGHRALTRLELVDSMHERKARMAELADAFVAIPGGIGTLDELMEVWTWRHLGLHAKPIALVNVAGFYDGLLAFIAHAAGAGLVRASQRDALTVLPDLAALARWLD
ncbi:MAG: TIGR00730 family Rossman fold protein [Gemmatimonadetes bacterium]|nr:TIGR00730 family Rossman fold protein [Gemmatimonadota bacterium]